MHVVKYNIPVGAVDEVMGGEDGGDVGGLCILGGQSETPVPTMTQSK